MSMSIRATRTISLWYFLFVSHCAKWMWVWGVSEPHLSHLSLLRCEWVSVEKEKKIKKGKVQQIISFSPSFVLLYAHNEIEIDVSLSMSVNMMTWGKPQLQKRSCARVCVHEQIYTHDISSFQPSNRQTNTHVGTHNQSESCATQLETLGHVGTSPSLFVEAEVRVEPLFFPSLSAKGVKKDFF